MTRWLALGTMKVWEGKPHFLKNIFVTQPPAPVAVKISGPGCGPFPWHLQHHHQPLMLFALISVVGGRAMCCPPSGEETHTMFPPYDASRRREADNHLHHPHPPPLVLDYVPLLPITITFSANSFPCFFLSFFIFHPLISRASMFSCPPSISHKGHALGTAMCSD